MTQQLPQLPSAKSKLQASLKDLKYNFKNENDFQLIKRLPIENYKENERFKSYIDTNDEVVYPILPGARYDKNNVVEVIFMSFGNIVCFEAIPLEEYYINHLYRFLPYDIVRLFPDETDWLMYVNGKLTYSVPKGWKLLSDLKDPSVYHIAKGNNQIVLRVSRTLAPLKRWTFWRTKKDFFGVLRKVAILLAPIFLVTLIEYPKEAPPKIEDEEVVIYKVQPPPPPTPVPTPEPTEAPKVAEPKPTPKPVPQKIVKKEVPKPKPKVPEVVKTPPKRLVVQKGPPVTGGTGPKNPNAAADIAAKAKAQAVAQAKAKVSNALGFLAKSNGLIKVPATSSNNNNFLGGRGLAGLKDTTGKDSALAAIGKNGAGSPNGPINTTGSRNIASGPVVSDGEVYGTNKVLAKVSVSGLHAAGGSGSFGPGGMSTSGNIDQDAVRRAIEKYMSKIRYCYEKTLLSKPSLSGSLRVEWTVNPGGRAANVRVTQSALNDATLHGCVSNVISTIPFPNPKGGPASVGYPFDFKPFN